MLYTFQEGLQFFPPKKSNYGNLRYRGCEYQATKQSVETIESEVVGKYRGANFPFKLVKEIPIPQATCLLTYRGTKYIKAAF